VLSGDDSMTLPFMAVGAKGIVSVAANIVPAEVHALYQNFADGKIAEARKVHYKMAELFRTLFIETNPLPVKTSLAMMGYVNEEWRMPLCEMTKENRAKLKEVLKKYKLVK
jgi:4-hydroxy-tetrahydrodipicolinate synthase